MFRESKKFMQAQFYFKFQSCQTILDAHWAKIISHLFCWSVFNLEKGIFYTEIISFFRMVRVRSLKFYLSIMNGGLQTSVGRGIVAFFFSTQFGIFQSDTTWISGDNDIDTPLFFFPARSAGIFFLLRKSLIKNIFYRYHTLFFPKIRKGGRGISIALSPDLYRICFIKDCFCEKFSGASR